MFVAFAAVSFASCGNKAANNNTEATDSVAVVEEAAVVEEVVADSAACDSTAACCDSTKAEWFSTSSRENWKSAVRKRNRLFYVFTPPFSANIPSFCNTNYLLLFLKPQTKTGYEKDKSKRNTSKLEVGKLFPWIIYCYHWSIYHSCRTDFISNSSQEKQIKESMQMIKWN